MVKKPAPAAGAAKDTGAEAKLQDAQARVKTAEDRHAAIVGVLSRLGVSPQDKRLAQAESKKAEHELREAKRLLAEAQGSAGK
jgi:hypothetical protein